MKKVFLIEGKRSPYVKAFSLLNDVNSLDLGVYLVNYLKTQYNLQKLDDFIIGSVYQSPHYANFARNLLLHAGLPDHIPAYTVQRNCASGLEAIRQAYFSIQENSSFVLAGGVESMSSMPLLIKPALQKFLLTFARSKKILEKISLLKSIPFKDLFSYTFALEEGLKDGFLGCRMGDTAEYLAKTYNITREEQDLFSLNSHKKASLADFSSEIVPYGGKTFIHKDIGPRENLTIEQLQKLKPYFDPSFGSVTTGNSSPITDGAAVCLIASEEFCNKEGLTPIAEILGFETVALNPRLMGLGPVQVIENLLQKFSLTVQDIDLFEINEAFAAQILSVLKVLKDKNIEIPLEKLNTLGGAIALGHPVGSSGSRLPLSLAYNLKKNKLKYGIATLCIGGGQGQGVLLKSV
jgi:acetyl-CoA acetyltransferase family protein